MAKHKNIRKFESVLNLATHKNIPKKLNKLRRIGLEGLIEALNSVLPHNLISKSIKISKSSIFISDEEISRDSFSNILIVGGGKATGNMCKALIDLFEDRFTIRGLINIPYGQKLSSKIESPKKNAVVEVNFCNHPIPDKAGVIGVQKMIALVKNSPKNTLIIALISGGGSSLLPLPVPGILLKEIKQMNDLLLKCGASIQEINCVRKHVSSFKGGNFARIVSPRILYSLIISDVIGNDLQSIASGPTVPDLTTFHDAKNICFKYGIFTELPQSIQNRILKGFNGKIGETPKPGDNIFKLNKNIIIGSAETSAKAAASYFQHLEINTKIFSSTLHGEAKKFEKKILSMISESNGKISPRALIGTGEFTVTVKGKGKGGRNQEMLLGFLSTLEKNPDLIPKNLYYVIISGAFDGIEGNSSAMGGIIDSQSLIRIKRENLVIDSYLNINDSYNLFKKLSDNIITGQTGTNVNDMTIILIEERK